MIALASKNVRQAGLITGFRYGQHFLLLSKVCHHYIELLGKLTSTGGVIGQKPFVMPELIGLELRSKLGLYQE